MKKLPKVDAFLARAEQWRPEMEALREIALACDLTEEMKWGWPCYASEGSNIVLIHAFKEYCAYLFFKGVLLKDAKGLLIQQTANVQSARQIRFSKVADIVKKKATLRAYIHEAMAVEKAGLKVTLKKTDDFAIAEEFQEKLDKMPALKAAFAALTPGRQKGYLLHFSGAKRPETREARVEKCLPLILKGKGLDD